MLNIAFYRIKINHFRKKNSPILARFSIKKKVANCLSTASTPASYLLDFDYLDGEEEEHITCNECLAQQLGISVTPPRARNFFDWSCHARLALEQRRAKWGRAAAISLYLQIYGLLAR